MDAAPEDFNNTNYSYPHFQNVSNGRGESFDVKYVVITITVSVMCIFGAMGNGIVIWLLGFHIKRNPFMTYILNLAVADLGVLLSVTLITSSLCIRLLGHINIDTFNLVLLVFFPLFLLTYSTGQCLLMAISVDRCVAVFFPLWHQCKQPPRLSTIVCAVLWVLSVLLTAITFTLMFYHTDEARIAMLTQLIVNALLCLPVMTIATVSLFIRVCLKARQHRRGKLLTIVLLTLLFFLLFAFPLNVISTLSFFIYLPNYLVHSALLLACLNSGVNPVIYFLVGRQWKSRRREGMKMILQKVFKEEEGCTEETPVETQS